jgi:hypothetical protein
MAETVLFDLFGVIAHHQSPERRNRLLETAARGISCRIGHAKPNPAAFRWCLDALAVPANQVVFVDDRGETSKPRKPSALDATCSPPPHASANSSPLEPSNPSCRRLTCERLGDMPLQTTRAYAPRPHRQTRNLQVQRPQPEHRPHLLQSHRHYHGVSLAACLVLVILAAGTVI